jgi:hypothetical protein
MRFAFADPPYPGKARRYYSCAEVDHAELIERLCSDYQDGWVLSTDSLSLRAVLGMCPDDCRVGAWLKPGSMPSFGSTGKPFCSWEPVIFRGGRARRRSVADSVCCATDAGRGFGRDRLNFTGAKPFLFCRWVVGLLGARGGDTIDDLFSGTGRCSGFFTKILSQLDFEDWEVAKAADSDSTR